MENTKLEQLIKEAKVGNENAISELYQNGKDGIYFTCLKILNNSEDALDITQDTFLTVFEKINTLEDYNSYASWQKTIAINKCKNYLIKNKPVLFTDNKIEDLIVSNIEDMDSEFIPHDYIDNLEKRNIIMEILDNKLSDVQRISTILFYYEEKSIKDISSILECSEGTVKSRLSSSRRIMKSEIEKIESNGIKLHSITGIPVLSLILQETAKNTIISQEISREIFKAIINNLEAIGVIGASLIGGTQSGLIAKIVALIKSSTIAKIATTVVILTTVSTTIALPIVIKSHANTSDVKEGELVTEEKVEQTKPTEVVKAVDPDVKPVETETVTAKTPDGETKEVEVPKLQEKKTETPVATEQPKQPDPEPQQPVTPKQPEPQQPVTPSIPTGFNQGVTNDVMAIFSNGNTNNSDIYDQHNVCTPEYYTQFQSIAGQYLSGSISDPSAIKSVRGDHNVTSSRVFYTVTDNLIFGEATGRDVTDLCNSVARKGVNGGGCLAISCSYNGSSFVARFVYADCGCEEN